MTVGEGEAAREQGSVGGKRGVPDPDDIETSEAESFLEGAGWVALDFLGVASPVLALV